MKVKEQLYHELRANADELVRAARDGHIEQEALLDTIEDLVDLLGMALGFEDIGEN